MIRPAFALVIDDDEDIRADVEERLEVIGHRCVTAGSIREAREAIAHHPPDYVLLDLEIPVRYGRPTRKENGLCLLGELNGVDRQLPVVVMTAHGHDSSELAAEVMRHGQAVDYVRKPFPTAASRHRTLESAARYAADLRRGWTGEATPPSGSTALPGPAPTPAAAVAFRDEPRHLVIHQDRVTLCDIEVWNDCAQDDMREVLLSLAQRTRSGTWRRVRGTRLNEDLGRDPTNGISKPIHAFRVRCQEQMRQHRGLACDRFDVIGDTRGGGYHFQPWIEVEIAGEPLPENAEDEAASVADEVRAWVLEQLAAGEEIYLRDVVAAFAGRRNRSSINRDLKAMREEGLVGKGSRARIISNERQCP